MHECLLCGRDMKTSKDTFGNGCIRNIYSFLEMDMPKQASQREKTLYNNIMKTNNIHGINNHQKIWLTDRYLTKQYLDGIHFCDYTKITNQIDSEIQNIINLKNDEQPKSAKTITLNQAYNLYKKVLKFEKAIKSLRVENFTDEDKIRFFITSTSFIFHIKQNKNQYEKNTFKAMQYIFWQTVIEAGREYAKFDISADFLQHSLKEKPNDLLITDGKVVKEIVKDKNFQENIINIINQYGEESNEFTFDSSNNKNFKMTFSEKDLYYSLNNVGLYIKAKKNNKKWDLYIKLHDRYDYDKFKKLKQYYKDTKSIPKSMFSSTLYNLAHYSVKFGVMKEYDIDIQFKINDNFEVIE